VERVKATLPYLSGILLTPVYAIVTYVLLKLEPSSTMSIAFLFTLPVAIGVVSFALAPPDKRGNTWYLLGVPWIAAVVLMVVATAFLHEAMICVIMALPLLLPLVTVGAMLALVVTRAAGWERARQSPLLLVALAPHLISPIEAQINAPDSVHVVQSSVIVYTPPEVVWQ
jgi:hypothetical protein